jgi:hypothetical protein
MVVLVDEVGTAKWVWSLLRGTIEKFAMAGRDQIKDPEIDECFDWDPSYLMLERCEDYGWIPAELRALLNEIDAFLDQLSGDPRMWSDAVIISDPLWEQVRHTSQEALLLMPREPWVQDG